MVKVPMTRLDMLFSGNRKGSRDALKTIEVWEGFRAHSNKQTPSHITKETSLLKDLEADSLEAVEILMEISDEFGIEISDEEAEKFQTVGDIVEYVEHHID